jgi:hypothetical protein
MKFYIFPFIKRETFTLSQEFALGGFFTLKIISKTKSVKGHDSDRAVNLQDKMTISHSTELSQAALINSA